MMSIFGGYRPIFGVRKKRVDGKFTPEQKARYDRAMANVVEVSGKDDANTRWWAMRLYLFCENELKLEKPIEKVATA